MILAGVMLKLTPSFAAPMLEMYIFDEKQRNCWCITLNKFNWLSY